LKERLTKEMFLNGILQGNRQILSKAITLIESTLEKDRELAAEILNALNPYFGKSIRIGITGSPGVGKSTLIEALGNYLTSLGKKVAVLAIDPTSPLHKGSILGDKTRMESLANNPSAFVRPSPTNLYLGGTGSSSREAMLLCEAAGFDVILIETVGVGQSETQVKNMVDFFLLLILAGSGDELQGIKKGIMEMANAILITKADGDNLPKAKKAKIEYENAIHYSANYEIDKLPINILLCSAQNKDDIKNLSDLIFENIDKLKATDSFDANRNAQNIEWMHELIKKGLIDEFYKNVDVKNAINNYELGIKSNTITPTLAAKHLINISNTK
jgi:LAO/AO transport system kinase